MRTTLPILVGCGVSLLVVVTAGSGGRPVTLTGSAQAPGAGDPAGEVGIVTTGPATDLRPGAPLTGCSSRERNAQRDRSVAQPVLNSGATLCA